MSGYTPLTTEGQFNQPSSNGYPAAAAPVPQASYVTPAANYAAQPQLVQEGQGGYPSQGGVAYQQAAYQQPPMGLPVAQPYYNQGQFPQQAYVVQVAGVPNYGQPGHLPRGMFSDTLCDCFDSFGICLLSWCVSPFRYAQTMERLQYSTFMNALFMYGTPWVLVYLLQFMFDVFPDLWWLLIIAIAMNGFMIYLGTVNRTKIRQQYQIPGGECEDCLLHTFCRCCAIAQEARHVDRDYAIPL